MIFTHRGVLASAVAAVLFLLPVQSIAQSKWLPYQGHLTVHFMISHNGLSTTIGSFRQVDGELLLDEKNPEGAEVNVRIEAASFDTGMAYRDHFVREAFLEAKKFRFIDFKSTKVNRTGETTAKVTGDLTMHGVTKPVTLDVRLNKTGKQSSGADHYGFSAKGTLNRLDWDINAFSSKSPPAITGETIDMLIAAEFIRQ